MVAAGLDRTRHWVLYEPMAATGDYGWKLRVACALLSLDAIEPYLEDIGRFRRSDAPALRALSRQYLERWGDGDDGPGGPAEKDVAFDPQAWLDLIRQEYGEGLTSGITDLADALVTGTSASSRHGWTELMAKLAHEHQVGSTPDVPPIKFQAFERISTKHLESMEGVRRRIDEFAKSMSTAWDKSLLQVDFYPNDDEDQESRRFDPKAWLWELWSDRQWQSFATSLHRELTLLEIDKLLSWARALPGNAFGEYLSASM